MKHRIERLRAEAEDCLLISNLTTDYQKEAAFRSIGRRLRELAADLEKLAENNDLSGLSSVSDGPESPRL